MNRTLKEHLTLLFDDHQSDWDLQAALFLRSYRCMSHSTTGITPCMLMFGRPLSLPADLEFGAPFHDTCNNALVSMPGIFAKLYTNSINGPIE